MNDEDIRKLERELVRKGKSLLAWSREVLESELAARGWSLAEWAADVAGLVPEFPADLAWIVAGGRGRSGDPLLQLRPARTPWVFTTMHSQPMLAIGASSLGAVCSSAWHHTPGDSLSGSRMVRIERIGVYRGCFYWVGQCRCDQVMWTRTSEAWPRDPPLSV